MIFIFCCFILKAGARTHSLIEFAFAAANFIAIWIPDQNTNWAIFTNVFIVHLLNMYQLCRCMMLNCTNNCCAYGILPHCYFSIVIAVPHSVVRAFFSSFSSEIYRPLIWNQLFFLSKPYGLKQNERAKKNREKNYGKSCRFSYGWLCAFNWNCAPFVCVHIHSCFALAFKLEIIFNGFSNAAPFIKSIQKL